MTDHESPTFGLDDATLERAAEALYAQDPIVPEPGGLKEVVMEMYRQDIFTALPVLVPAIERALIERMQAGCDQRMDEMGVNMMDAYMKLRVGDYLPAADEQGATR